MHECLLPHMLCSLPMKILLHGQRSTSVKPAFHMGNGAKAISRAGREVFAEMDRLPLSRLNLLPLMTTHVNKRGIIFLRFKKGAYF